MIFGTFEILGTLSRRNLVTTYKCSEPELGLVVLKVFDFPSEEQKKVIKDLSRSLKRLSHKGLQPHLKCVENEDKIALVFGWVEGVTLAEEIEDGQRYSDAQIFDCMGSILEALEVCHGLNPPQIHRDIKPENVVHTSDGWVLIDFGASRELVLGDGEVSVIGTTGYAAPEQFFGRPGPSSDQYGLGATILHLATHRHPTEFPLKKLKLDVEDASLSRPLQRILQRMLSPDPEERFVDVSEALGAVRRRTGMSEWEYALEPIRGADSVLQTRSINDSLEIQIGARYKKLPLVISVLGPSVFVGLALWAYSITGRQPNYLVLLASIGVVFYPIFIREWKSMKPWTLHLSPQSWHLMRNSKLISEGQNIPEIVSSPGFLGELDSTLNKRIPVKLKCADQESSQFGHSLTARESEVLRDLVRSYYQQYQPAPQKPKLLGGEQDLVLRAPEFLEKWEKPTSPIRNLASHLVFFRTVPATPRRVSQFERIPASSRQILKDAGFTSVGYLKEAVLGLIGPTKEVLLSEDGAIAAHISPGVFGESESEFTYFLTTLMSDGSYRITWSHRNPSTPSSGRMYSVGSSGSFERDLAAHREWIAKMSVQMETLPVTMGTMDDRVEVSRHYMRHITPVSTAVTVLWMVFSLIVIVLSPILMILLIFL